MPKTIKSLPVYIGYNSSLSDAIDTGTDYVVGIIMPEVWTIAQVSVQVSTDGAQYHDLFDFDLETGGTAQEVVFNVTPGVVTAIDPNTLLMARYIKLRSGTRNEPINQAATCMFTVITVPTVAG